MKKFDSRIRNMAFLVYRWVSPIVDPVRFIRGLFGYFWFFRDWIKYSTDKNAEKIHIADTFPCLHDKKDVAPFDRHYFYQDIWAYKKILKSGCKYHVDVGSRTDFVGLLTAVTKVTAIDIRPLNVNLENFESKRGSILQMPFESDSVSSLSCLHVAEHIGLGRYGDSIDPLGTEKAAKELKRILAANGNLFFSLPMGRPRLCFNGHRIHSSRQILDYFRGLKLMEFSGIDDGGNLRVNIEPNALDSCNYGCGLFWFRKPQYNQD
jgi:SAM-dependent methyltransferase